MNSNCCNNIQLVKLNEAQNKVEDLSTRKKIEGHLKSAAGVSIAGGNTPGGGSASVPAGATRGSLKSTFRCLQVSRLSSGIDPQTSPSFLITYATKEKKQKSIFHNNVNYFIKFSLQKI